MGLNCGCEFKGGMEVEKEFLQTHYKHTVEAVLVWEMIHRKGRDPLATLPLSQARIDLINAIAELYPEVEEN